MTQKLLATAGVLLLIIMVTYPFQASPPPDGEDMLAAMQQLGYTAVELRKNVQHEFEVEAKLNGDKKITMILSFQATNTIFNTERLDEMGVKYQKTGQKFEVNGDKDDLYAVRTDSINIGNGKIGPEELHCLEFDEFDVFEDYRVTGILGRDFLLKHHAVIDFADQMLYIKPD
ncbi:MAG: hypothetical protein KDD67_00025 [Ignavibacteriae bacterium]|nr:hypothetical protein [Ignavibacteriota bacterium]MCB9214778.1 hypothetical protein [Ignavibacteria bacterium]